MSTRSRLHNQVLMMDRLRKETDERTEELRKLSSVDLLARLVAQGESRLEVEVGTMMRLSEIINHLQALDQAGPVPETTSERRERDRASEELRGLRNDVARLRHEFVPDPDERT